MKPTAPDNSDGGAVTDRLDSTSKAKLTSSRLTTTRLSGLPAGQKNHFWTTE